jgi:hypothetical protein
MLENIKSKGCHQIGINEAWLCLHTILPQALVDHGVVSFTFYEINSVAGE